MVTISKSYLGFVLYGVKVNVFALLLPHLTEWSAELIECHWRPSSVRPSKIGAQI